RGEQGVEARVVQLRQGLAHPRRRRVAQAGPGHAPQVLLGVADAMRAEYRAIVAAGLVLQLDCPGLAMGGNRAEFADATFEDCRAIPRRTGLPSLAGPAVPPPHSAARAVARRRPRPPSEWMHAPW